MTKGILASMALALLCAGSMEASAALSHKHSDRVAHHPHLANQNFASMPAAIPERPTVFPSVRSWRA
jgi:hypothetical protein